MLSGMKKIDYYLDDGDLVYWPYVNISFICVDLSFILSIIFLYIVV